MSPQAATTRMQASQATKGRRMARMLAGIDRSGRLVGCPRREPLIDRLISAAGAVSHAAGRLFRAGGLRQRSASMLVAGVLTVAALAGVIIGLRADDTTLREFTAGELATGDHGQRSFANVSGSLASTYVETYQDLNDDGQHQADEKGEAWNYFLVDEESRAGVTVQSVRSPAEIYTYRVSGVVVEDATYLAEDLEYFKPWLDEQGITLDPLRYIDATKSGAPTKVTIAGGLPARDSVVEVEGSRSVNYLTVCSADTNDDGVCSAEEIDLFDVLVYDPLTKKAVTVLTATSPEFVAAEFIGMLEKSPRLVTEAQKTDSEEFKLGDFGISVSPDYLLSDGEEPAAFGFLIPPAILLGLLALVIAVGAATGYLRFRPSGPIGSVWATLEPGGRIPLRVTGELRTPQGLVHVREAPAELVRFVMTPAEQPTAAMPPSEPSSVEAAPTESRAHRADAHRADSHRADSHRADSHHAHHRAAGSIRRRRSRPWRADRDDRRRRQAVAWRASGVAPGRRHGNVARLVRLGRRPRSCRGRADCRDRRPGRGHLMDAWELSELDLARAKAGRLYHEFFSVPDLSGGLYVLEAGATDPQSPHTEDELYIVMSGTAKAFVGGETRPIVAGSVIFVAAGVEHRFLDIEERLVLLVVFGPAEYSRGSPPT